MGHLCNLRGYKEVGRGNIFKGIHPEVPTQRLGAQVFPVNESIDFSITDLPWLSIQTSNTSRGSGTLSHPASTTQLCKLFYGRRYGPLDKLLKRTPGSCTYPFTSLIALNLSSSLCRASQQFSSIQYAPWPLCALPSLLPLSV